MRSFRSYLLAGVSLDALNAGHMAARRDAKGTHGRYLSLGLLNNRPLVAWLLVAARAAGRALVLSRQPA